MHVNNIVGGYIVTNEPLGYFSNQCNIHSSHTGLMISPWLQQPARTTDIPQSTQMNSLNFILLLVCFTPVSLQNGAEITNLQSKIKTEKTLSFTCVILETRHCLSRKLFNMTSHLFCHTWKFLRLRSGFFLKKHHSLHLIYVNCIQTLTQNRLTKFL